MSREREMEIGNQNIIGKRMTQRRADIGMKQKTLHTQLFVRGIDLSASAISKIEGQTRSVCDMELVAIANVLDVPVTWLLGIEE